MPLALDLRAARRNEQVSLVLVAGRDLDVPATPNLAQSIFVPVLGGTAAHGAPVRRWRLHVRTTPLFACRSCRFRCREASCGRWTFVEQMPGLTRRYSRWTERLRSTFAAVGLALAGRAGARMASVFGVAVSRSTVL